MDRLKERHITVAETIAQIHMLEQKIAIGLIMAVIITTTPALVLAGARGMTLQAVEEGEGLIALLPELIVLLDR